MLLPWPQQAAGSGMRARKERIVAMREGSAEVVIACPAEAAFAWLADPRNAGEWFASVTLPEAPARPLRAGVDWRFSMTRQRGKIIPMRLAEYQPPQSFTWETTYPAWRDNLRWSLTLAPEPAAPAAATRLRMTIRLRPGPLGWPALLLATLIARLSSKWAMSVAERAARAARRACEALEALPTLTYGPYERRSGAPRGKGGKGGKHSRPARP